MVTAITEDLLSSKRNRPGTKCSVRKGIVIHYTANTSKGANAKRNRDYFNTTTTYASTHFLVDDTTILQAVPVWEVAWAVGAKSYTTIGKKLFHNGQEPNYTTVSIEMCVNSDADFQKVVENTVWLTVKLMKQLNLGINDIYRHYDITTKSCPLFYLKDADWKNFLSKVEDAYGDVSRGEQVILDTIVLKNIKIKTNDLNVRKGPDTTYEVVKKLNTGDVVSVYEVLTGWYRIDGGWINSSSSYSEETAISVDNEQHVINTSDTLELENAVGRVKVEGTLNVRKGILGVDSDTTIVTTYKNDQVVELLESRGNWYRTKDGWVSGKYIERLDTRYIAKLSKDSNIRDEKLNIIGTGKAGDDCIIFAGSIVVDGFKIVPIKIGNLHGYVQFGSYAIIK